MKVRTTLFFVLFMLLSSTVISQVQGTLTDKNTLKPIKNAIVFIDRTSLTSTTDDDGKFMLEKLPIGFVKLIIFKEGYTLFNSMIRIEPEKIYTLKLSLEEVQEENPKPEYVKRDEAAFTELTSVLNGKDATSSVLKINKNKQIRFVESNNATNLVLNGPLQIENTSLGYQLNLFFQFPTPLNSALLSKSYLYFDTLISNPKNEWGKKRNTAYFGSIQHFLKSIFEGTTVREGFRITTTDGAEINPADHTMPGKISGYTRFDYNGRLNVQYHLDNPTSDQREENSLLTISNGLDINTQGMLFNDASLTIEGRMATELSVLLPLNFEPESTIKKELEDWKHFAKLQEKTYLSTDQDYYYPGETIWFSAVMNYRAPEYADTLSKVLYVELIDTNNTLVAERQTQIINGMGQGEIELPDSIAPSLYYLRAYTSWMRNFGDSTIFMRPLPILDYSKSLQYDEALGDNPASGTRITLTTTKNTYEPEEEVNFTLDIRNATGNRLPGRFSLSVIDLESTTRIPDILPIQSSLKFGPLENAFKEGYFDNIQYNLERGISFSGQITDSKNNSTQAHVEVVNQRIRYLVSMETDEKGKFTVLDLNFFDSLAFSIKPTNAKGKPINNVTLLPKTIPPFQYNGPLPVLKYQKEVAPRIRLLHEDHLETKVLEEVSVTAKRIDPNKKKQEAYARLLGRPDNVVQGDIFKTYAGNNFLEALQGRVPGLRVIPTNNGIDIKLRGMSMEGSTTPLILVDGVEFSINSISAIPVAVIDHVDVIRRAMPIMGSRGGNGVIAIYTKTDVAWTTTIPEFTNLTVKGYNRLAMFIPDHFQDDAEKKSISRTNFWQPVNYMDEDKPFTGSFFASHLPGRYGIIIKGIANNGIPFEHFTTINVN